MNNIPNSTLYNFGVSNKTGFTKLPTVWSKFNNKELDKFDTEDTSLTFTATLDYLFEQNVFNNIDFLKVDVEGHEYEVFEGLSDENLSKIKNISVEIHGQHIKDNPKLGLMFQHSLRDRLYDVPYFDGSVFKQRSVMELFISEQGFLYSTLV